MASELHQAVLHGQAAAVQALLLRPLMVGTAEDLTRRQAARAEPAARLRAAERALTEATEAEKAALKARVAADDLYHAIQAEGADWAAQHEADKAKRARSPRDGPADEDVIVATGDAGSPRLLSPEELQSARRRKCRSAQTFTSEVAQRAVLPAPWEPLPEPQQLSDEDRAQAEARLSEKLAAGKASPLEAARLRQHRWVGQTSAHDVPGLPERQDRVRRGAGDHAPVQEHPLQVPTTAVLGVIQRLEGQRRRRVHGV